jgi:general secretion pathway protein D
VFSSFGLSEIDPLTGLPVLTPGTGFNGILLAPDAVNAVVQALATDSNAKVLAAPKILVNDNATGTLASVLGVAFTSVNASDTVATTSFAGYATAGTTVTITPHISEGEHLQLKYSVTLSSFTDDSTSSSTAGIPPPRQDNTITSEITVPNGYGVVVGGLKRRDHTYTASKVPFLGDLPVLGYLFSLRRESNSESTLFVFIRPLILRDDKFQDLKYLSDRELNLAELPGNLPDSEPIAMQ